MRYFYETFLSQSTILTNLWGKNNFKKIENTKKNNNHKNLQIIL